MFRASSAHLPPPVSSHSSCVPTSNQELSQRVTVPHAARIQLYPPEDEHLRLETCRGDYYFMNK